MDQCGNGFGRMREFAPFEVVVPCSTANLGPGFDSIGMALNRYLRLRFSPAKELSLSVSGPYGAGIELDQDNLIVSVMKQACAEMGLSLIPFQLEIENEIPLARGLGSSAAAIVGACMAVNHLYQFGWDREEILKRATKYEGHPDNVGASIFGGVVIGSWDGRKAHLLSSEAPNLPIVVAIPKRPLSTKLARHVLPSFYDKETTVLSSSRANLLVAALLQKRWDLLQVAMQDLFHQPYRETLVPGLWEILKNAVKNGAYGAALSGAGPTILAFARDGERLTRYFKSVFSEMNIPADITDLKASQTGAFVQLTAEQKRSRVLGKI
ncbi:homoserine kinase [Thermoactinomyces sp. CICC 10522]|uniref:homoserine kinase n=1 Tax=Thermoactinomyces sp. CICC 10522 TaxID=2767427 RepID=UPI0018DB23DE|nr:homoserine kinase [Thermoactinomyces sp. CICC 10522]MBH8603608.1 homoserine kinase [Thermoactinomyces sp. CICC 10522]